MSSEIIIRLARFFTLSLLLSLFGCAPPPPKVQDGNAQEHTAHSQKEWSPSESQQEALPDSSPQKETITEPQSNVEPPTEQIPEFPPEPPRDKCEDDQRFTKVCKSGHGPCAQEGFWLCKDKYTLECTAPPPDPSKAIAELCNGKDDDCDGDIDEDWPTKGQPCVKKEDHCEVKMFYICKQNQQGVQCGPDTIRRAERCNDEDDDCDGKIDEDFPNKGFSCTKPWGGCQVKGTFLCAPDQKSTLCNATPTPPSTERCDNKDNDCNGYIDDVTPAFKMCKTGNCQRKIEFCKDGKEQSCPTLQPTTELCNGHDDDCDGQTDEGCAFCVPTKWKRFSDEVLFSPTPTYSDNGKYLFTVHFGLQESQRPPYYLRTSEALTGKEIHRFDIGQYGEILDMASNQDGSLVAVTTKKGYILVFHPLKETRIAHLIPGYLQPTKLDIDPTDTYLAATANGTIWLYDLKTFKLIHTWTHGDTSSDISFMDGGKLLLLSNKKELVWWDVQIKQQMGQRTFQHYRISTQTKGTLVLLSGYQSIKGHEVFDVKSKKVIHSETRPGVVPLSIHPTKTYYFYTLDGEKTLHLYDFTKQQELESFTSSMTLSNNTRVPIHPSGNHFLVTRSSQNDQYIRAYQRAPQKTTFRMGSGSVYLATAQFTPDQKYLFTIGMIEGLNKWTWPDGRLLRSFRANNKASSYDSQKVAFSPDFKYAYSANDKKAEIWNIETETLEWKRPPTLLHTVQTQWLSDSKRLILQHTQVPGIFDITTKTFTTYFVQQSGRELALTDDQQAIIGIDKFIELWDITTQKTKYKKIAYGIPTHHINHFSPKRHFVMQWNQLIDLTTGELHMTLPGTPLSTRYHPFSNNEKYIVTAGSGGEVFVTDIQKKKTIFKTYHDTGFAISDDGLLAVKRGTSIFVYDANTGDLVLEKNTYLRYPLELTWSSDNKTLFFASLDGLYTAQCAP